MSIFLKCASLRCSLKSLLVVCAAVCSSNAASADVIVSPNSIVSNSMGSLNGSFLDTYMINQNGLSATYTSGVTDATTYLAGSPTHANTFSGNVHWLSNSVPLGNMVFDLGAAQDLTGVIYSQLSYSGHGARRVVDVRFEVDDNVAFTSPTLVLDGTFDVNKVGVLDLIPFTTSATGQYVRFHIDSNATHATLTHLGELAFTAAPAAVAAGTPEPSTVVLSLLGMLGLVARRRSRHRRG